MLIIVIQEKEMEKQKILYQQARLHARGAAEMVLQMISATKGGDWIVSLKGTTPLRDVLMLDLSLKKKQQTREMFTVITV